jgi:hypothetical protein
MPFMTVASNPPDTPAFHLPPSEPDELYVAAVWLEEEIRNAIAYDNHQVQNGAVAVWTDFVEHIGPELQEMIHACRSGVTEDRSLESFNIIVNRIINEYIRNRNGYTLDDVIDSSSEEISKYLETLKLFWQGSFNYINTKARLLAYIATIRREHLEYLLHTGAEEMQWGPTHHRLPRGRVPSQDHHTYTHWDPPPPRTWSYGALAAEMSDSDSEMGGGKKSRKRRQTGKPKKSRKGQTGKPKKSRKGQRPRKPKKSRKGRK